MCPRESAAGTTVLCSPVLYLLYYFHVLPTYMSLAVSGLYREM